MRPHTDDWTQVGRGRLQLEIGEREERRERGETLKGGEDEVWVRVEQREGG